MSEDILERAKRVEYPDSALRILPELIAEVERLQAKVNEIAATGILAVDSAMQLSAYKANKDRDAWKAKAIEERAICKYLSKATLDPFMILSEPSEEEKEKLQKEAARELEEEMKDAQNMSEL